MIDQIKALLAEPLDKENGHLVREQMSRIEAYNAIVRLERNRAKEALSDIKGKVYDPSLKTELERKTAMERMVRAHQLEFENWDSLADSIKERISMGQSFLKSIQAEIEGNLR